MNAAAFLLLLILALPASCPLRRTHDPEQNAAPGKKPPRNTESAQEANKKQAKATRKYAKAQRKENAKANRDLQKRRGR